jgi:hypothetical protein
MPAGDWNSCGAAASGYVSRMIPAVPAIPVSFIIVVDAIQVTSSPFVPNRVSSTYLTLAGVTPRRDIGSAHEPVG